ncbi:ABC transporter ATP-binding protein [Streptosporangium canum]|uniref:ABC transporter ATP-binding protein n=1 Tax=Streptosporangium canum TaxID=324952 RepID=UPI00344AE642
MSINIDGEAKREHRSSVPVLIRRILIASSLAAKAAPGILTLYLILTLAGGTLPVVSAWLTKLVIDDLIVGVTFGELVPLAIGLGLAGLVATVTPQATQYLRTEMDREVGLITNDRLFSAVDSFVGLGRFENPQFLDQLRLAQQTCGSTPNQTIDGILGVGRAVIIIIGFLGSLLLLSPLMTVLVLLSGVPVLAAEIALSRQRGKVFWEIGPTERREFFYSQLLSRVEAAKEIRLFGAGSFLRGRMLTERRTANSARRALDRREFVVQTGLGILSAVVSGGGLLWAVSAAHAGRLSAGDIMVFAAAVVGVQGALALLAGEIARSHQALLMFDHYISVTSAGPDLSSVTPGRPLPSIRQGIELRDVWFRYAEDHPWVLRGVNLHIPHGKAVALVGINGSGKSTLVKLLCRFYDPTHGAIMWDGVDIREVEVTELRRRIGAVFQDYMNYDMTAAENIAIGDLGSLENQERIQDAARRAGVHDRLTELPQGYETLLSRMFFTESDKDSPETGVVLSGGQWQRLALARAFLRDQHDLMILDEPSAGLDSEAEYEIHTSLKQHRAGRTSVLISHRLGAVRDADLIVVLSDGEIVERGDHATLMAQPGKYARLFMLQASGYQPEEGNPVTVGER